PAGVFRCGGWAPLRYRGADLRRRRDLAERSHVLVSQRARPAETRDFGADGPRGTGPSLTWPIRGDRPSVSAEPAGAVCQTPARSRIRSEGPVRPARGL